MGASPRTRYILLLLGTVCWMLGSLTQWHCPDDPTAYRRAEPPGPESLRVESLACDQPSEATVLVGSAPGFILPRSLPCSYVGSSEPLVLGELCGRPTLFVSIDSTFDTWLALRRVCDAVQPVERAERPRLVLVLLDSALPMQLLPEFLERLCPLRVLRGGFRVRAALGLSRTGRWLRCDSDLRCVARGDACAPEPLRILD